VGEAEEISRGVTTQGGKRVGVYGRVSFGAETFSLKKLVRVLIELSVFYEHNWEILVLAPYFCWEHNFFQKL
jgi:hypothetical protein